MPAVLLTILLIPIFWVLIVRPQQKRQKAHVAIVASLEPGDRVESFSGIHGTLTEVHDTTVRIEVAPGVVLTMARLAISTRLDDDGHDGSGSDDGGRDGADDDVEDDADGQDGDVDPQLNRSEEDPS